MERSSAQPSIGVGAGNFYGVWRIFAQVSPDFQKKTSSYHFGPHFLKSKHIKCRFCSCKNFHSFCPDFHRFCPDFKGFCPNFHQIRTVGGAISPPALPPLTPLPPLVGNDQTLRSVSLRSVFVLCTVVQLCFREWKMGINEYEQINSKIF